MQHRRSLLRLAVLGALVVTPALAKPPHAPSDQYDLFVSNSPVIIDRSTKLTWERNLSTITPGTWTTANNYCALTFGGRLPTIKELLTLVDEEPHDEYDGEVVSIVIDPDAFGYKTPVDVGYWTSTPNSNATSYWSLEFKTGTTALLPATTPLHYRCVKP